MLCKIYSIILVLISTTTMISIVVVQRKQLLAHAEAAQQQREQQQQQQHHDQQLHPPLLVDTKYWIKNTEFGERDNWRLHLKPCTLIERIQINERAVISMGDSLDALGGSLESNIRELVLPVDGILLLEEDTLNDSLDPMFVQYLNQSGDCFESSDLNYETGAGDGRFHFEPHSDDMSWFNPANWASSLNEDEIADWVPESHLVPCSEDIVVFGSRHATLTPVIESNERAQLISFKINFRPSQMMQEQLSNISLPDGIRVSKLKIGEQTYNQQEFEQLINSNFYKNILFELSDNRSVLRSDSGIEYNPAHSLITIDETSIQADSSYGLCLDEAGCLCGNEDANVMQIICSFNYPLEPDLLPCYDPIQASGYCNKICATVLTITMDPTKFSERFLANVMNKKLEDDELFKHLNDNVFMGARRVDHNKYEVTFRPVPSDSKSYEMTLGTEIELAQLFRQHLENGKWRHLMSDILRLFKVIMEYSDLQLTVPLCICNYFDRS